MRPTSSAAFLLTTMQAPETQSTGTGVIPSVLVVSTLRDVNRLLGNHLVRIVLRPKNAVRGVGKDLAEPWTEPSEFRAIVSGTAGRLNRY